MQTMSNTNTIKGHFLGDTTLTKVFVGGLAWETPREALRQHFDKYGDILEAVIISDKLSGRSKGYGFVTFKDAGAAKRACEDATPIINGRRANCNLASLGSRRSKSAVPVAPQQGSKDDLRATSAPTGNHLPRYFPAAGAPNGLTTYHHPQYQAVPFYGYSPAYISPAMGYNHKVNYMNGSYMNGQYPQQAYQGGQVMVSGNTLMPMYPLYPYPPQSHTMGLPAHLFPPSALPHVVSKPVSIAPPPSSGAVGSRGESIKKA